ncbi:DUF397 domain-containing protein [Nocardiopsis sp. LOL_012]|uniref:DUF397 domain-containing protein n=1 Tax=Nocardiopsis sp. LOL_012 TaxID=3345409 RepID=UPI003A844B2B
MEAEKSAWRKSRYSDDTSNCVQVRRQGRKVDVRDSQNINDALLTFPSTEWRAFIAEFCDERDSNPFLMLRSPRRYH